MTTLPKCPTRPFAALSAAALVTMVTAIAVLVMSHTSHLQAWSLTQQQQQQQQRQQLQMQQQQLRQQQLRMQHLEQHLLALRQQQVRLQQQQQRKLQYQQQQQQRKLQQQQLQRKLQQQRQRQQLQEKQRQQQNFKASRTFAAAAFKKKKTEKVTKATTKSRDQLEAQKRVDNVQLYRQFVTEQERECMMILLRDIDSVFNQLNISYTMYGGTLLGSYRHLGLIPWDDDLDLLVNSTARNRLPAALRQLAPQLQLHTAGGHDKISHRTLSRRTSRFSWSWPYLDVSYFLENSTHLWDHIPTYGKWFIFPKFIALPIRRRPFAELWLPAPHDTLAFLQITYGRSQNCVTSAYSHMTEGSMRSARWPCRRLARSVAFVHRRRCGGGRRRCLVERLLLNGKLLRTVRTDEPSFALNDPYSLDYRAGVTAPKYYPHVGTDDT